VFERRGRVTIYKRPEKNGYQLEDNKSVYGMCERDGDNDIVILGEAPGEQEDYQGVPFVGRSGEFLDVGLSKAGIDRRNCWVTNTITKRPPKNDYSSYEAQECWEYQKDGFWQELQDLKNTRHAKVVLALGNNPMRALGIEGNISENRGSVYEIHLDSRRVVQPNQTAFNTILVVPTYHPSYILRARNFKKNKDVKVDILNIWQSDLVRAREIAEKGWVRLRENFNIHPTVQEVENFINTCLKENKLVAIDTETTGLDYYADRGRVFVIGLAMDDQNAISVPMFKYGGGEYWKEHDKAHVKTLLNRLFTKGRLMFQNTLFDSGWLMREGYSFNWSSVEHDTLLLHHALDPELPHNLGFIVSKYGTTSYWKGNVINRKGGLRDVPDKELRTYNLRDCVVLHQVLGPMLEELKAKGLEDIYHNESLKLLAPIYEMIDTGVVVNEKKLKTWKGTLEEELEQLNHKLHSLAKLPKEFELNDTNLRLFLFNDKTCKKFELTDYYTDTLTLEKSTDEKLQKKGKRQRATKKFKEAQYIYKLVKDTKPLWIPKGFRGRKTKGGLFKVDDMGRLSLQRHAQNRLSDISQFKRQTEEIAQEKENIHALLTWLDTYNQYAKTNKMLTTYTNIPISPDGRVHTRLIIHGTVTGRLASREPNLQNQPKRNKTARLHFVAPKNYSIVSFDYKNLEAFTMGYETGEERIIEVLETGDLHDENTKALFGLKPTDKEWAIARRAAKTFQFGLIQYGGSPEEIYRKIIIEVPQLALTRARFDELYDRYMAHYTSLAKWRKNIEDTVPTTRVISTFMGRKRYLYGSERDIIKEALNFPNQGGAAHVINRCLIDIQEALVRERTKGLCARLQMQLHDDVRSECWTEHVGRLVKLVQPIMEQEFDFYGRRVRFKVNVEVGPSWGELEEWKSN
jgi:uracil-DNA glycosylase family 4